MESNLLFLSLNLRGNIIDKHSFIEKMLQLYIAGHFCKKNKRREFMSFVISQHIPFEKTRLIFMSLLNKYDEDFVKANSKVLKMIIHINEERNIVAHYMLNDTDRAKKAFEKKGEVSFMKFKNGIENEVFNKERMHSYLEKYKAVVELLKPLVENIATKSRTRAR